LPSRSRGRHPRSCCERGAARGCPAPPLRPCTLDAVKVRRRSPMYAPIFSRERKPARETPEPEPKHERRPGSPTSVRPFIPPPTTPEMFPGLVGRLVEESAPHTEAHPAAITAQFLVMVGNLLDRGPQVMVGETRHGLNENVLLVGPSAIGRKGDAWNMAKVVPTLADPRWSRHCLASGLSSGEGLIHAVRDEIPNPNNRAKLLDPGV